MSLIAVLAATLAMTTPASPTTVLQATGAPSTQTAPVAGATPLLELVRIDARIRPLAERLLARLRSLDDHDAPPGGRLDHGSCAGRLG